LVVVFADCGELSDFADDGSGQRLASKEVSMMLRFSNIQLCLVLCAFPPGPSVKLWCCILFLIYREGTAEDSNSFAKLVQQNGYAFFKLT
jgi:hypothetical protein